MFSKAVILVIVLSCVVVNANNVTERATLTCGGGGGSAFNDYEYYTQNGNLTRIGVWHGDIIDGIIVSIIRILSCRIYIIYACLHIYYY